MALFFCMPPLTWVATGLLAGWLAARRGKSWRWGFALGFFCSTPGVLLAALPSGCSPRNLCNVNLQGAIRSSVHTLAVRVSGAFAACKREPLETVPVMPHVGRRQ
jgi:hypothetical protein